MYKIVITSWKTTLTGIAAVITALVPVADCMQHGGAFLGCLFPSLPAIIAGIGLIFAKDGNVTGGNISNNMDVK